STRSPPRPRLLPYTTLFRSPPVDAQSTSSARPSSVSARIESAPPTTEYPGEDATASATAFVPAANRGHSNTPIGPFQKIVRAARSEEHTSELQSLAYLVCRL